MAVLKIGEYRPDINDLNQPFTQMVNNVLPQLDGYGPVKSLEGFTYALPSQCRGYFYAEKTDGSVALFAATSTKLYLLENSTFSWTDVSKAGGSYTALLSSANWTFAQFNDVVIACQANEPPQRFTLTSSSEFSDLGGSPPQAAYVAVVNRYLVLSGLSNDSNTVQWCDLNDIEQWSTGDADSQTLPSGGATRGVVGGEFGIIIQATEVRRMIFSPGSDAIFQIDRIAKGLGTFAPYSIVDNGGLVYFLSAKGFVSIDQSGGITYIGREKIDRTFVAEYDTGEPQLVVGVADPSSNIVSWQYKTQGGSQTYADKMLCYDHLLGRWSPVSVQSEYMATAAKPGLTLENLDEIGSEPVTGTADNGGGEIRLTVADSSSYTTGETRVVADVGGTTEANGSWDITVIDATHIDLDGSAYSNAWTSGGYLSSSVDDLPFSLDDVSTASLLQFSQFSSDHILGFFNGPNMEATAETSERSAVARRMFIRGVYPITDATAVYGSIAARENKTSAPAYSSEQVSNNEGFCPARVSTRHARSKLRIPAGELWSYISGVEPIAGAGGRR